MKNAFFSLLALGLILNFFMSQAQAAFLYLKSSDNVEVALEYNLEKNAYADVTTASILGVWVIHSRSALPIKNVKVVFIQRTSSSDCGAPASYAESVFFLDLPYGPSGFYAPGGLFYNSQREPVPATLHLSSHEACKRAQSINELAVVLADEKGQEHWLVDPVTGLHNFRLMF